MNTLTPAKTGLITGMIMIGFSIILFYLAHLPVNSKWIYAVYSIFCGGAIFTLIRCARSEKSPIIFKEYFSKGFQYFLVVALLMVVYTFIFHKLNPQIMEAQVSLNNQLAQQEKSHTPAEIEANSQQLRNIFMPMTLMITAIIYLFLGTLITVVTTAFLQQLKKF